MFDDRSSSGAGRNRGPAAGGPTDALSPGKRSLVEAVPIAATANANGPATQVQRLANPAGRDDAGGHEAAQRGTSGSSEALPHLKTSGSGRIINILASTVYQPIPNLALSGATRMGVIAFAKSLADEVGRDGILVNNVCPGSILSERMLSNVTSRAKELDIPLEEALKERAAETAVGRIGEPKELADLVTFLASPRASYITGTTMRVDGGLVRSVM